MMDTSKNFAEIASLLQERQDKEAALRELDKRIFALLGLDVRIERKRKTLIGGTRELFF